MMGAETAIAHAAASGVRLSANQGKLTYSAPRGALTPALRAVLREHKDAILELLMTPPDSSSDGPDPDHLEVARAISAYRAWCPLRLSTLCRAIIAGRHPLESTPVREFVTHLDAITPEFEVAVRRAARQAIELGAIPQRSVDLRGHPQDDLF